MCSVTDPGADRGGGGPGGSRPCDHAARIPVVPIQFINRVLDIPVMPQRQVRTVSNSAEYGRLHWCSAWVRLLPCPSLCNDRCRVVQTVQKTVWRCRCCSLLTRLSTSLLWRRGISLGSRSCEDDIDSSATVHRHGDRRSVLMQLRLGSSCPSRQLRFLSSARQGHDGLGMGFSLWFHCVFRTPSSWTSSPRWSPRWSTVVGCRGLGGGGDAGSLTPRCSATRIGCMHCFGIWINTCHKHRVRTSTKPPQTSTTTTNHDKPLTTNHHNHCRRFTQTGWFC